MATQFRESVTGQRLDLHTAALGQLGFGALVDYADQCRKLHDLWDNSLGCWVECKTDYSRYTERLLIECKANVPEGLLAEWPERQPIPHAELAPLVASLPSRYDGLGVDQQNLEPGGHFLSYLWVKSGSHICVDLPTLQRTIAYSRYDWLIAGYDGEGWRSVCQIVPVIDCRPVYWGLLYGDADGEPGGHWN